MEVSARHVRNSARGVNRGGVWCPSGLDCLPSGLVSEGSIRTNCGKTNALCANSLGAKGFKGGVGNFPALVAFQAGGMRVYVAFSVRG